jgi:SNF2 family DNA or RNA helicase
MANLKVAAMDAAPPSVVVSIDLKDDATLQPFQAEAVRWLMARERSIGGAILADEPGMGKTIMTIGLMKNSPVAHTLILAPKSVVPQWASEIRKFSDLTVDTVERKTPRPIVLADVTVAPYSVLLRLEPKKKSRFGEQQEPRDHWISQTLWGRAVIDEAHAIKNRRTKLAKGAAGLKTAYKIALTGTPIQNSRADLYALADWIGYGGKDEVRKICEAVVLRRTMEDVDSFKLPELSMSVIPVDLSEEERFMYNYVYQYARERAAEGMQTNQRMEVLEAIMRCRQMCCHPQVFINGMRKKFSVDLEMTGFDEDLIADDWTEDSSKTAALIDAIAKQPAEDKAIVFCSFVDEMRIFSKILGEQSIESDMFHGGLNSEQRSDVLDRFRDPASGIRVLFVQIAAGGVGLNLQEANRVYVLSPQWNPMLEVQALGRCHRQGQQRPVHFVRLIAKNTIEERICDVQERKLALVSAALNDPRIHAKMAANKQMNLTRGDVKYLFRASA